MFLGTKYHSLAGGLHKWFEMLTTTLTIHSRTIPSLCHERMNPFHALVAIKILFLKKKGCRIEII